MIKAAISIYDDETGEIFMENKAMKPSSIELDPKYLYEKYWFDFKFVLSRPEPIICDRTILVKEVVDND